MKAGTAGRIGVVGGDMEVLGVGDVLAANVVGSDRHD
jgi:hypothetical protein